MPGQQQADMQGQVHRVAVTPDGYAMAIRLATRVPVTAWHAEITAPPGAELSAGPHTRLDGKKATPAAAGIRAGGVGMVWVAVSGTQSAPKHVRLAAETPTGTVGYIEFAAPVVTDPRTKRVTAATEDNWPGSTTMSGSGGGSGGGGGGGGQTDCKLFVDMANQIVRHEITTDAGGGGGAGGGSGSGSNQYYDGGKAQ